MEPARVESITGPRCKGRLLTMTTNKRLGWKGITVTNNLAYYVKKLITKVKSFIV
jgi:hypothetical protein